MRFPPVLVLDCGASRVSAAAFTATSDGVPVLGKIFVEPLEYDSADDQQWVRAVGDAIRRIGTLHRVRGKVALIAPGHLTLTKYIKVPHVAESKRQRIIQFEARQNIPYPLEEVVWDYQIVFDDGIDFEIALSAIKLDIVEALIAECQETGFEPEVIGPASMGQVNAFRFCYPEMRESTLVLNIGARSSNLVFLREDRYFIRNVTLAGGSVTQAIADEMGRGVSEAEHVKLEIISAIASDNSLIRRGLAAAPSPEAAGAFDNARQAFATRLALEITRSIANYRRQSGVEAPTQMFITGGGSLVPELAGLLAEKLKIPVAAYEPLRGVSFGSGAVEGEIMANAHLVGEALGAAIGLYDQGLASFNLLPPRVLRARAFRRREPFYVASAALAAGALAIPILINWVTIQALSEKVASLDATAEPLRRYAADIKKTRADVDRIHQEIGGITGLVESKSNWIAFLTDLQSRLVRVEDVWLEKLEVLRPKGAQAQTSALAGSIFGGLPAAGGRQLEAQTLRLNLAGRLLDKNNPLARVSQESQNRVKTLLTSFVDSQFIVALEDEKFDVSQNGVLKFDFVLVVDPKHPL